MLIPFISAIKISSFFALEKYFHAMEFTWHFYKQKFHFTGDTSSAKVSLEIFVGVNKNLE